MTALSEIETRADWTDPPTIKWALDYCLDARARRREGLRLGPFYAEIVGYRWSDQERFQAGLERAANRRWTTSCRLCSEVQGSARPGRIVLDE